MIVKFNGKEVKVLPYDAKGKESKSITVDFTKGTPIVKGGTMID